VSIIEARDLVKTFRRTKRAEGRFSAVRTLFTRETVDTKAVDGVSFTIDEGEIVGYLGPNGAGKSTTIKMLTGILVPTSGSATVAGLVPWDNRERNARNIGVVFGQRSQLWWDLPLDESFQLIGTMYQIPPERFQANLAMLTELLDMEPFLQTPVRQLSLGQRMRGDLAAAMLYEPRILFLDEPTVGLDVVAKERMRTFIEEINRTRQTTVVLTTHDLDDVERLCRRIVIIDHGRVVFDGETQDLRHRFAPHRLLDIVVEPGTTVPVATLLAGLPPGLAVMDEREAGATISIDPEIVRPADAIALIAGRVPVIDLTVREPDLDGIIRQVYAAEEGLA